MSNIKSESHFRLRLPRDVRAAVEAAASRSERTLNGEMLFQLKQAYGLNEETAGRPMPADKNSTTAIASAVMETST